MALRLIVLLTALVALATTAPPQHERSTSVTTESMVKRHGYPFEEHLLQTSDGYILGVHRIPYSARVDTPEPRPVAFLMHGVLSSSSDWVILGPDNGLAFILSDLGYDVWMGNARGNTYSRKHVSYSTLFSKFWNFDWHEIGIIDLPAMIDYVRYTAGVDQVRYFAHSQGTTSFFLLNSMSSTFKNRIKSAHLMAPVAYMNHMKSPLAKIAGPLLGHPNMFIELFGSMEFLPNTKAMELLGYTTCRDKSPFQALCSNALFLMGGFDPENFNTTLIPEIMATSPAGSSINQFLHYLQEFNSGYFRQFDYGIVRNEFAYGSLKPPSYNIAKIDVPIFLYYSDNDYMASVVDVHRLIAQLPSSSLRRAYRVPHKKWSHLDYLYGMNIWENVYNALLEDIASIE